MARLTASAIVDTSKAICVNLAKGVLSRAKRLRRAIRRIVGGHPQLPKEHTAIVDSVAEQVESAIEGLPPADALRILFTLDDRLYLLHGRQAVAYGGGVHTKHRHMNFHAFFTSRLAYGECVLDIGCGNGALTWDMAEKAGARVTGIDLSPSNIAMARKRFAHDNAQYVCGDALTALPSGNYTTIVMSNVLEHLPERALFLKRVQATFLPRRFLIRVPLFERDWRVPLKKELGLDWRLDDTHEIEYTQESFTAEVAEAGLVITHQEVRWGEIWCELVPTR